MLELPLETQITICITTKDRWEALSETIRHLCDLGLEHIPAIIIDDGSAEPLGEIVSRPLKACRIIRHCESAGLIARRNELARNVQTPFLLSLDDDSYPLRGARFDEAVTYMRENPEVDVLGFRIHEPRLPARIGQPGQSPSESARPVRSFIGCGHLMRVAAFVHRSGYRTLLFHMSEERDYSLRVYGDGHRIVHFPGVEICHERSPQARSSRKNAFYGARNTMLLWILNLPFPHCVWRTVRSTGGLILASFRERLPLRATLSGIVAVIPLAIQLGSQRTPMSAERYRIWLGLRETGDV